MAIHVRRPLIGIDPGKNGGLATYDPQTKGIRLYSLDTKSLGSLSKQLFKLNRDSIVYIENVGHGRPGNAIKAMTTFARHCGHLDVFLHLYVKREPILVSPVSWMNKVIGPDRPKAVAERKKHIIAVLRDKYPVVDDITLKTADALGILAYGIAHDKGEYDG
jgi:hypothetical protein